MISVLSRSRVAVRRLVGLAGVVAVLLLGSAAAMLAYTAHAVDRVQAVQERAMVANGLRHGIEDVAEEVASVALSDQAHASLTGRVDIDWADHNLGRRLSRHFGHDLTLVISPKDTLAYAWAEDGAARPSQAAAFMTAVRPLVARGREAERIERYGQPAAGGEPTPLTASGFVVSEGRFYMVGLAEIAPRTRHAEHDDPRGSLLVSARAMDAAFLSELQSDLSIQGVAIEPGGGHDGPATTPLVDVNGFVAGALSWTPGRPGISVLGQTTPLILAGLLGLAAAGWALSRLMKAILDDLDFGDAALARSMRELVDARDMAEAANTAKSQFLANMSHEIRTPLNGVLGMAQVMARDTLAPSQAERLKVIRDSGETLLSVLNDILDFSKIEAGKLEIDPHAFDLAAAVGLACAPFASLAERKGVDFQVRIPPEAWGLWWGDAVRLRQILSNLASNAVKFTAAGQVSVTVERMASGLRFRVADSGIGIPAERLRILFDKFSQVDASTTRRFGGTGLGLAISRELAELMGGRLHVESREGEGSTFILDLPLEFRAEGRSAPAATEGAAMTTAGPPTRILAAEDNVTNQFVLRALLEPLDVELTIAADGLQAVAAFREGVFDLVLMDAQMPEMNGMEATAAIRAIEAETGRARTPILALSANAMSHQVREYLDAGMDGFVAKPIEAAKLVAAISEALDKASPADLSVAAA